MPIIQALGWLRWEITSLRTTCDSQHDTVDKIKKKHKTLNVGMIKHKATFVAHTHKLYTICFIP